MMTKDEAARCLSVLLHELTKPWRKEKIHSDVLEIIMKLRIQAADDERYMNNLLSNIAFAGESAHALKQIWSYMLREQTFLSPQTIEAMLTDAQQAIRRRLPELTARYERPFLSIDDPLERKRQLEGLTQKSAKKRTFGVSPLWFLYILPNGTKFRLCSPPHLR
ncbi:hypothetical protein, partial [Geobacillus stearothermophilus]|nr:hypothetical protein [Geobacillus stearothermophilus]